MYEFDLITRIGLVFDQVWMSLDEAFLIQQLICLEVWFEDWDWFGLWSGVVKFISDCLDAMIMTVDLIAGINLGLWFGKGELMLYFVLAIEIYLGNSTTKMDLREKKFVAERGLENCKMFFF